MTSVLRRYAALAVKTALFPVLLAVAAWCAPAQAAISLSHTRLVVSPAQPEATPRVMNEGDRPVLLQLWFDTGNRETDPRAIVTPFIVTPPVMRLEPGATRRLRIMYTGHAGPPAGRESVYWLNILEIPPKAAPAGADRLQISFRTRVKLFFRPDGVRADPDAHQALRFEWRQHGQQAYLHIANPARIHQTLLELAVGDARPGGALQALPPPDMLGPGASVDVPAGAISPARAGIRVHYSVIDDHGAVVDGARDIAR